MDPTATWRLLVASLHALARCPEDTDQREATIDALRALATWLARGGFPPAPEALPPQGS